jgi:hypothetical protein
MKLFLALIVTAFVMLFSVSGAIAGLESCRIPIVRNAEQAPVIDGTMKGTEWKYALAITGLVNMDGPLTQRGGDVYLVSDGDNLYVGIYSPAVPEGTVPEVKAGPSYSGTLYEDFIRNDRIEARFSPPNRLEAGDLYVVTDSGGNTFFQRIKGEFRAFRPEVECKTSSDEKGWTTEIRIPAKVLGLEKITDSDGWKLNASLVRLFPLKYEGLVKGGPHTMSRVAFANDAPAISVQRLGDPQRGKLDLSVTVREYEGVVATPKEGAYDERKVQTGGMTLKASGRAARVSYELLDGQGAVVSNSSQVIALVPAKAIEATFKHDFKPQPRNTLRLKVESAESEARFASGSDGSGITIEYQSTMPFTPYSEAEEASWQERLTKGTVAGSWRMNAAFFPYWNKAKIQTTFFKGRVREQASSLRVTVTSDKGFKAESLVPIENGRMKIASDDGNLEIAIPGLPEGTYTTRGEVLDAQGQIVTTQERTYVRKVFPWEKNTLGLSRGVIKPWTPMVVTGTKVECWGRSHELDPSGLPSQIVTQGKPVLTAPIAVELRGEDSSVWKWSPQGKVTFVEQASDRVRWTGQATIGSDIDASVTGLAEYDGFTWFEVTLSPRKSVSASSGRIVISLPKEQAQLLHFQSCWARDNFSGAVPAGDGTVFRSLETINYGKVGGFSPHVWMGNLTRGLSWYADSDEGWSSSPQKSAIEIVRTGDQVQLVLNIITRPVTLTTPRTIRFGLMASPVKPLLPIKDIQTRAVNWLSFKDKKTVVQEHMYAPYPPGFDYKLIDEHVPGRRLYFNKHEMGAAMAERDVFDNEWGGIEPAADYPGAPERFGPGIRSRTINRSLTNSRIDMLVYYIAQMAKNSSMAATYWDITGIGMGVPLLEEGMAYRDTETGRIVTNFDILKSRQLFKRVATVWQEIRGEPDYMEIHSTNHICPPFYGFAYSWLNFEWLWPNEKARRPDGRWQDFIDLRPLDLFATEGVPSQFGVWINSMNAGARPTDLAEHRRIIKSGTALEILHNHSEAMMGGSGLSKPPSIGRRDELEFIGYWDESKRVTTDHPKVLASFWRTKDRIEVVAVNLTLERSPVTVSIPLKALGWTSAVKTVETTDDADLDALFESLRRTKQSERLATLEKLTADAKAVRKPPVVRVVDGMLKLTLDVESHEYRVFVVEGQ